MQLDEYFLNRRKSYQEENEHLPLCTRHCFYWSPSCFAEIRSEEVMACFGLSAGVSVSKFGLEAGASMSYSQCDNKKLLDEGMLGR